MPRIQPEPTQKEQEEEEVEEVEGGFLKNLSPEELQALEERKTKAAAAIIAARERAAIARAKEAFEQKKMQWKKSKAYVKGSKVCEANNIYEEDGWYICQVCNKKLQDIEWVEEHVRTEKHKRNMDWYGSGSRSNSSSACTSAINKKEFVQWDESEMIYRCTLCDAKAASEIILQAHLSGKDHTKRVANKQWYTQQSQGQLGCESDTFIIPAYCEYIEAEERYVCLWCEKRADGVEMLKIHLHGNEHRKRCSNIGIPGFGEPLHLEKANRYFEKHGADLWARDPDWPEFIIDEPTCWNCSMCRKKFITPVTVTEHLKDKHSGRKNPIPTHRHSFVELIRTDYEGEFECNVCYIPFPTKVDLERHEAEDPGHQQVLRKLREIPTPTINIDYFDDSIQNHHQTLAKKSPPLIELDI